MAKRKTQQSPRIIYLACEGTETEYWYFKSLGESLDEDENVELRVYPDQSDLKEMHLKNEKGVKTDHKNLCVKVAEKLASSQGIDEGWIIIDKDGHLGLEETFSEAIRTDVRIAFSSVSFEHWLLLHFEKNETVFQKSDCKTPNERGNDVYVKCGSKQSKYPMSNCHGNRCVAGWLRFRNYLPDFDKSNKRIFQFTQPYHALAFENAAWLRWRKYAEIEAEQGQICQINPYSNVDALLKSIYQNEQVVSWSAWGVPIKTSDLELNIQKIGGNTYNIHAHNFSQKSQLLLPDHFHLSNEHGEKLPIQLAFSNGKPTILLLPQQEPIEFKIMSNSEPTEIFYLNYSCGNHRLIFSK